jgi:hypothetical protein
VRIRTILALFMAFAVLTGLGVYVVARTIGNVPLPIPLSPPCHVGSADDGVDLDATQMANSATIAAVGIRRGVPTGAIVVALATAWQESRLENLSGGDRDSVGLFQQRPSQDWGSPEQISDPRYAAGEFYKALLKVPGWQKMRVTDAAQAVQRSAHPEAYEQWAVRSELLARALTGEMTGAVGCKVRGAPGQRGEVATKALVESLTLDWGDVRHKVDPAGLTVTVRNGKTGWQYAHWLVAYATESGVRRVRFGDQEWSSTAGTWARTSGDAALAGGDTLLAEVNK